MMKRWQIRRTFLFTALLALPFVICTVTSATAKSNAYPLKRWTSSLGKKNVLVGKIWSVEQKTFLTPSELIALLVTQDFILLGENHDNADHHELQAWVLRRLRGHDRRPVVIMEMIDKSQADALKEYRATPKSTAAGLGPAIGWKKSGWPDWKIYAPIAKAAFAGGLQIAYGNPSKQTIRSVGKKGFDGIPAAQVRELTLDQNMQTEHLGDLLKELEKSHCGYVKGRMLRPMAKVQRLKDAYMADRMLTTGAKKGAVLIAGNGHVRTDRGVPFYIKKRDAYFLSKSLMFLELPDTTSTLETMIPKTPDGKYAADYVWFTPMVKRPDQCEQLKKHFRKKKKR